MSLQNDINDFKYERMENILTQKSPKLDLIRLSS